MPYLRNETTIFKLDAVTSAVLGAAMVLLADALHDLAGGGLAPPVLRVVGAALLPWAAHNAFTGRAPLRTTHVVIQLAGDAFWVLASFAIVATQPMERVGVVIYVAQALMVASVFAMKAKALRVREAALRHQ